MMKKTVYIVTSGSYSDYHIVAVFSAKRKAQYFVRHYEHDAQIEEYIPRNNHLSYTWRVVVWMDRDGNTIRTKGPFIVSSKDSSNAPVCITYMNGTQCLRYQTSNRDVTAVIKKTNEIRAALLITLAQCVPPEHSTPVTYERLVSRNRALYFQNTESQEAIMKILEDQKIL